MDKRTLYIHNKESKRPFNIYDVSDFERVYIDGNLFPLEINNEKLTVKGNRSPKPFKQHDEMIKRFIDAGITFEKEGEVDLALSILPTINYYRISVYRLYLGEDKSFTRLNQLYDFDTKLRELVSKMLPAIENGIKATLAYAVTKKYKELNRELIDSEEKYEALAYMDHNIYKKDVKSEKINIMLSGFADLLTSKQDKDPVIKHHLLYYFGQIPMWVLVEFLTLGDIYTMIMYLDREYRKDWVRSTFGNIKDTWIIEWVKTIQLLRNTCAHNARLYGSRPPYNPFIPDYDVKRLPEKYSQEKSSNDNVNKLRHTIFAGILTMRQFYLTLSVFDKEKWNIFLKDLSQIINEFDADLYRIGFPENWGSVLKI